MMVAKDQLKLLSNYGPDSEPKIFSNNRLHMQTFCSRELRSSSSVSFVLTQRNDPELVTFRDRDLAVTALRCLNTFYRLDHQTFATAVHLLDQFLSRLKVKKKHLSCVAAACYLVACKVHEDEDIPTTSDLSVLYGKEWSPADLCRMEAIVLKKLEWQIFPLSYYQCILIIIKYLEKYFVNSSSLLDNIVHKAEISMGFTQCAIFRDTTIALSCTQICLEQEEYTGKELSIIVLELQCVCDIPDSELFECKNAVKCCIDKHNLQSPVAIHKVKNKRIFRKSFSIKQKPAYYGGSDLPTIPEDTGEITN